MRLSEVFGTTASIRDVTYVDRDGLDRKFQYLWKAERHIVLHGSSKQGKSWLRKRNVDQSQCVVIQCLPNMATRDLWESALRTLGASYQESEKAATESASETTMEGGLEGGIPGVVKGKAQVESGDTSVTREEKVVKPVSKPIPEPGFLASELAKRKMRLVLEDFHYLNDETRKQIAFDLKAFYEYDAFVLIVGIWEEPNLLLYYNGDLRGRVEEISITWRDQELKEVLEKGAKALNITFSNEIQNEMVSSCFGNVGLIQAMAEKLCQRLGILERESPSRTIDSLCALSEVRAEIAKQSDRRYDTTHTVFKEGIHADTKLKMYHRIFKFLTEASDKDLIEGISESQVLRAIQAQTSDTIRAPDLQQALVRIENLQQEKQVNPMLARYNRHLRSLVLTDREFLFYRKYGNPNWNWEGL